MTTPRRCPTPPRRATGTAARRTCDRTAVSRALITGGSGFAGRHLADACAVAGDEVTTAERASGVDLLDAKSLRAAVAAAAPDVVYHLAARAHVGESWKDPAGTIHD